MKATLAQQLNAFASGRIMDSDGTTGSCYNFYDWFVCSFIGFRFPSGLACLDLSGRKIKWKSVWGENFKIDA